MQFSDTTNKSGLLQDCEFLTNLGDAIITGDTTLKARFTSLLNIRYAQVMARLQTLTGAAGPEDTTYTSEQFSTFDIVKDQNSYTFTTDEDGNTISDIVAISILPAATSTEYLPLAKMTLDDSRALRAMSPNPSDIGVPCAYLEKGLTAYFDVTPNYAATDGGKLYYRLVPSYFTTSDTTKAPGFDEGYHRILSLGASLDWLRVNKAENTVLIQSITADFQTLDRGLEDYMRQRYPTRRRVFGSTRRSRTRSV